MTDGSVLVEAKQCFSGTVLAAILDQVRNRLLDFLLELKSVEPEGWLNAVQSDKESQARVGKIVNTTIYGSNNVVASGEHISQTRTDGIAPGDPQSLLQHFRNLGLGKT